MASEKQEATAIREAINAGKQIAEAAGKTVRLDDGRQLVFVPEGFTAKEVEALDPILPGFIDDSRTLVDQASFTAFVNRFKQTSSVVFGMPNSSPPSFKAIIDFHSASDGKDAGKAGRIKQTAAFDCQFDLNWKRWQTVDRQDMAQVDFAYFVEEMLPTIGSPDGADLLEMAQNLKINRNVVFKANKVLRDGTNDIEYLEKDETSGGVGGHFKVPDEIVIVCPVFMLREPQQTVAKLRYRVEPGQPLKFRVDILRRQFIEFDAFRKMADEVARETDLPVFLSAK